MSNASQVEIHLLENYLLIGGLLFAIGLVGFLSRRNMIVMFLAAEMMLQGVSVSLVGWGRFHDDWGGQMLVIFILTVAACEAAIALALVQNRLDIGGRTPEAIALAIVGEVQAALAGRGGRPFSETAQ